MITAILTAFGLAGVLLGMIAQARVRTGNPLWFYAAFILSGLMPMLGYYTVAWLFP